MQNLEFVTTEEYTKEDIKKVQQTLLNMAKVVAKILEEHYVPYMIAYGTLLGAIRHEGFIPWDDDFDFYLFDDSYDEAIEILRKELPNDLFLEDEKSEPLYFHAWAHVKDLNSVTVCDLFPQDNVYFHKGISVDLYRTNKMKRKDLEKFINDENEKYIERKYTKKLISEEEYIIRKNKLEEDRKKVIKNDEEREIFGHISEYSNHFFEIEDVLPLKKYKFEDCYFYGPNKVEKILKEIYGNYELIPPVEKRKPHYSRVEFI